mmetsp:Transcript_125669/g.250781  ORF Transcript_125669/g.250781 Transcript_125669/m.250781 type:complete len:154 (-) Transcript_125669:314-775(-)
MSHQHQLCEVCPASFFNQFRIEIDLSPTSLPARKIIPKTLDDVSSTVTCHWKTIFADMINIAGMLELCIIIPEVQLYTVCIEPDVEIKVFVEGNSTMAFFMLTVVIKGYTATESLLHKPIHAWMANAVAPNQQVVFKSNGCDVFLSCRCCMFR